MKGYLIEKYTDMGNAYTTMRLLAEAKKAGIDLSPVGVSDTALVEGILMHRGKRLQDINERISKKMNDVDLKEATIKEDKKIIRKVNKTSESEKLGTVGRLFLPSIDLNVAVYNANLNTDENYNAQSIVDKVDSAAYFKLGPKEAPGAPRGWV